MTTGQVAREMRPWTIAASLTMISLVVAACAGDDGAGGASAEPPVPPDTSSPASGANPSDPSVDAATKPQGPSSGEEAQTPPDVDLSIHKIGRASCRERV